MSGSGTACEITVRLSGRRTVDTTAASGEQRAAGHRRRSRAGDAARHEPRTRTPLLPVGDTGKRLDAARRAVEREPGNIWKWIELARLERRAGDLAGAAEAYEAALEIAQQLAAADPQNAQWQRDLVVSLWRLADLAERQNDPVTALGHWQEAARIAHELASTGPLRAARDEHAAGFPPTATLR